MEVAPAVSSVAIKELVMLICGSALKMHLPRVFSVSPRLFLKLGLHYQFYELGTGLHSYSCCVAQTFQRLYASDIGGTRSTYTSIFHESVCPWSTLFKGVVSKRYRIIIVTALALTRCKIADYPPGMAYWELERRAK